MVLDSIGVGLLGSTTQVFQLALQHCQINIVCLLCVGCPVQAHSMNFDNTWHPAIHPSGVVLSALLVVSNILPNNRRPSGRDFLLAFNVGIDFQGRLMRFTNEHGSQGRGQGSQVLGQVQDILLSVPRSKYINGPFPESAHQDRHSFQFNACSALLGGEVTVFSFSQEAVQRPDLLALLGRVRVKHPHDNPANFDLMYGEVKVTLLGGDVLKGCCDTFYGNWRNPLTNESLKKRFRNNAMEGLIEALEGLDRLEDCCPLLLSSLPACSWGVFSFGFVYSK
uniref:Immunoresponsive gene 1, like n=1 Tax=Hucho hucho TaxID=62062 RepID=A0A4W5KNL6_9TELE